MRSSFTRPVTPTRAKRTHRRHQPALAWSRLSAAGRSFSMSETKLLLAAHPMRMSRPRRATLPNLSPSVAHSSGPTTTPSPRAGPSASDTHRSMPPASPPARGERRSIRRRPRPRNRRGSDCESERQGRCGCATRRARRRPGALRIAWPRTARVEPASTDARDHIGGKPRRRYGGVEAAGALAGAGLGAGGGAPTHSASAEGDTTNPTSSQVCVCVSGRR